MKKASGMLLLPLIIISCYCQTKTPINNPNKTSKSHPACIMQGNIYEVNIRQYKQKSTFRAFAKHRDRLKAMDVQTVWFMPVNPISSKRKRKRQSACCSESICEYTACSHNK